MKPMSALAACVLTVAASAAHAVVVFNEGDLSTWTFGSYGIGGGTATVVREAAGGNPGARVNVTTVTNSPAQ